MTEPESRTIAWMRRLDAKLDAIQTDLQEIKANLAEHKDELTTASALALRATGERIVWSTFERRLKEAFERIATLERKLQEG